MKQAPLQLIDYWSVLLHVEANPNYQRKDAQPIPLESLKVTHAVEPGQAREHPEAQGTEWDLQLTIEQTAPDEVVVPYFFKITMQGILQASPAIPRDRLEKIVAINGPALLFGAAREVIRASTSRGPYPAVVIPSTNFLPTPEQTSSPVTAKKKTKKTATKKRAGKKPRSK